MHTYEVLVDIKEYLEMTDTSCRSETARYEIDAESKDKVDRIAREQARNDHPQGIEYDIRVTRLLK